MRWFAAIPLALLPLAAGAAAPMATVEVIPRDEAASAPDRCDPIRNLRRSDTPGAAGAQRLIDLPPGNLDLAVMRRIGECPEPVTIGEGYGAFEGPRAPKRPRTPPAPPRALLLDR